MEDEMRSKLLACAAAFLAAINLPAMAQQPAAPPSPPCTAPSAWFPHSQTPEQNSTGFPAAPKNCDFHQWSWNAFLWLTQDVKGEPRFEHMPATEIGRAHV